MKRIVKRILPILLCLVIVCSLVWYIFVYDRGFMQDVLLGCARLFEGQGNHSAATWLYNQAYQYSGQDDAIIIELAERFKKIDNYTQAEIVLTNGIKDGGSIDLYLALSKTYVEQDKLLDAVAMLENVTNPDIKAQLNALRPAPPAATPTPDYYTQYINVTLEAPDGNRLCVASGDNFPSVEDLYQQPIALVGGENTICAITIGENGLVSKPAYFSYIVGGVIEQIQIADPVLDSYIRDHLDMAATQPLYSNDLWSITELNVPEGVTDLSDLRRFTYLENLVIDGLTVENVQAISNLTQLKNLTIRSCPISAADLGIIGALPNLESLTLTDCSLSNISPLAAAKRLVHLDLSNNAIQDLSALSFMDKLSTLNLSGNALTNLSAISGLDSLTALDVSFNSLTSIAPLSVCPQLVSLSAANNQLTEMPIFDNPTLLTMLVLSNNDLADVSTLSNYTSLSILSLSYNKITNVSCLSGLNSLTYVDISNNKISALPAWEKSCALVEINASNNRITSVAALGGLMKLNNVYLDNNKITNVNALANCQMLVEVSIYGNYVKDVSKLKAMSIIVYYTPV